jgi:hypothetical protein
MGSTRRKNNRDAMFRGRKGQPPYYETDKARHNNTSTAVGSPLTAYGPELESLCPHSERMIRNV